MIVIMAIGLQNCLSKQGHPCICYDLYRYTFRVASSYLKKLLQIRNFGGKTGFWPIFSIICLISVGVIGNTLGSKIKNSILSFDLSGLCCCWCFFKVKFAVLYQFSSHGGRPKTLLVSVFWLSKIMSSLSLK